MRTSLWTYRLVAVVYAEVAAAAQPVPSNVLNRPTNLVMLKLQTTDHIAQQDGHLTDQLLQHLVQQVHLYQAMLTSTPVPEETTNHRTG